MQHKHLAIFMIALLALGGCGSIVKKPQINNVKSAAIISIYANGHVPEAKKRGSIKGWNKDMKQEVSAEFLDVYSDSLGRVMGWKMVDPKTVTSSAAYQEAFKPQVKTDNKAAQKLMKFAAKLQEMSVAYNYFSPKGMQPIELSSEAMRRVRYVNGKRVDPKMQLADFAKKLNVDAVVVVQLDYCYKGGKLSLGGTGKAYMTAASSIRAIDQKGNMVINMGDLQSCVETKNRAQSEQGYAMVGGNLLAAIAKKDTLKRMFNEATNENAKLTMAQLQKAMK